VSSGHISLKSLLFSLSKSCFRLFLICLSPCYHILAIPTHPCYHQPQFAILSSSFNYHHHHSLSLIGNQGVGSQPVVWLAIKSKILQFFSLSVMLSAELSEMFEILVWLGRWLRTVTISVGMGWWAVFCSVLGISDRYLSYCDCDKEKKYTLPLTTSTTPAHILTMHFWGVHKLQSVSFKWYADGALTGAAQAILMLLGFVWPIHLDEQAKPSRPQDLILERNAKVWQPRIRHLHPTKGAYKRHVQAKATRVTIPTWARAMGRKLSKSEILKVDNKAIYFLFFLWVNTWGFYIIIQEDRSHIA